MEQQSIKIGRFDQVKLLTTKNVRYLSAPGSFEATPGGIWSVVAAVGNDLLAVKNNVTIRIPATDVLKVADYNLGKVIEKLGRLSHGQERRKGSEGKEGNQAENSR